VVTVLVNIGAGCGRPPSREAISVQQGNLQQAINDNDFDGVRNALAAGASVAAPLPSGRPPLGEAVLAENLSIVKLILRAGADPNQAVTPLGGPPIAAAATTSNPALVRELIRAGADPNRRYGEGLRWTPLGRAAVAACGVRTIGALVDGGADPNMRILEPASDYPLGFRQAQEEGKTPLMLATDRGLRINVIILLGVGADPAIRDEHGRTAWDYVGDPTSAMRDVLAHPKSYMFPRPPNDHGREPPKMNTDPNPGR